MLCLLAFTACQTPASEPRPPHADPPPPLNATSPDRAFPPGPTPPPTTGTSPPPPAAPPLVTPPPPPRNAPTTPEPAPEATACQKDSDCALTYVPETGCCPTLCAPRGVN